jgi:hypothetical protein
METRKTLGKVIEDAQTQVLEKHRRKRRSLIQEVMADQHPDGSDDMPRPVNLLEVARNTYQQELMPGDLRVLVTPRHPAATAAARGLERGTNERIIETHASREVESALGDSLFLMGVVRVTEETTGEVDVEGLGTIQTSATSVRAVPMNRFFYDVEAERWPYITFSGEIFTVPLDWAQEFKGFNRKARKELRAQKLQDVISSTGLPTGKDTRSEKDRYLPHTQLAMAWLPMEGDSGKIVTMEPKTWNVLDEKDWDGPEVGPYHYLTYNDIPGELSQISPLAILKAMHQSANTAMCKVLGRIERTKEVGLTQADDQDLVDRLNKAFDGEWLRGTGNPDPVKQYRIGGIGGDLAGAVIQMRSLFSWLGGGIEIMGGMRAPSETLGQDRILSRAASKRMKAMSKRVEDFSRGIVKALAWYEWTDPIRERQFFEKIQRRGLTYEVPLPWTPETRLGSFLEHDVQVDVYALQHRSPEERMASLLQSIQMLMSLYPLYQAQGGTIDVAEIVRLLSRLRDQPELAEIFKTTTRREPQIELQPPPQAGPPREPAAGRSQENQDDALTAQLMGAGNRSEPGEIA